MYNCTVGKKKKKELPEASFSISESQKQDVDVVENWKSAERRIAMSKRVSLLLKGMFLWVYIL